MLALSGDSLQAPFSYPGGADIGASFYPQAGCYSSRDSATVCHQLQQLQDTGVDVAVLSWWGVDSFEDRALPLVLNCAQAHDIAVCIHLEPYPQRDATSTRDDLAYLQQRYGAHPAWYREPMQGNRTFYYIYDSYQTPLADWARLLTPGGDFTLRGTELDAVFIALLVEVDQRHVIQAAGFDGCYSYFGAEGFSYGSTPVNWPLLTSWGRAQQLLFIPCVAPGYDDTRVRPWNGANTRDREQGRYYDRMWAQALAADPDFIGVTSFNEWHEGTQIEPAIPATVSDYSYTDYLPLDPEYYLRRTRFWADRWRDCLAAGAGRIDPDCVPLLPPEAELISHLGRLALVGLNVLPDLRYPGKGAVSLVDGQLAESTYRDGRWLGFAEPVLQLDIDLGKHVLVTECRVGFLQQQSAWIFPPTGFQVAVATDAADYQTVIQTGCAVVSDDVSRRIELGGCITPVMTQYLRIDVLGLTACPQWHMGAGEPPWIFIDEVIIK